MLRRFLSLCFFLFLIGPFQQLAGQIMPCQFDLRLQENLQDGETQEQYLRVEKEIQRKLNRLEKNARSSLVLPVVIHVVYRNEKDNISRLQILSQLEILNQAFSQKPSLFQIPDNFKSRIDIPDIQFCLAKVDPQGNPSTGITRKSTQIENIGIQKVNERNRVQHDNLGGSDAWDTDRYINIWVSEMGEILGEASFPGVGPAESDGLLIHVNHFGNIGTTLENEPYHLGKTAVHEMGHYFGLYHLWGKQNTNCTDDDEVSDTPLSNTPYLGCPSYPQSSCDSEDMLNNFMDFSHDACLLYFTKGQSERMLASLESHRASLMNQQSSCFSEGQTALTEIEYSYINSAKSVFIEAENIATEIQFILFNMAGQEIQSGSIQPKEIKRINLRNYPSGIYILNIFNQNEKITFKIPLHP